MTVKSGITKEIFLKKIQDEFISLVPLDIPLKIGGINLGTVKIDFEINKNARISKKAQKEIKIYYNRLRIELRLLKISLNDDMNLSVRVDQLMKDNIEIFHSLLSIFHSDQICPISLMFFIDKEDKLFQLISTEGPKALRDSRIQFILSHWLSDDVSAKGKIDKLTNALMKYSYGEDYNDRRFPDGRPPLEFLNKLGTDWIMNMLEELTILFREVKSLHKKNKNKITSDFSATQLINEAYERYLLAQKVALKLLSDPENRLVSELFSWDENKESKRKLMNNIERLKELSPDFSNQKEDVIKLLEKRGFLKIIIDCIDSNEALGNLYKSFLWQPSEFAKKIIANMLGISVSTIEKIKKSYSLSQIQA